MADLYADWLGISPGKRPPNHFELLGVSIDETNAEVVEQAARAQAQKIRERVDATNAEAAKSLMQELGRARAILLDPAKRAAYRATLKPAAAGGAEPWWKQEVLSGPADQAPVAPPPRPMPAAQRIQPAATEFEEIDDGIRRRRKKSGAPVLLLLLGGGGILLAIAGAVAAIFIFTATPEAKTSDQAKHHPPTLPGPVPGIATNDGTPTVTPDPVKPANVNPPIKSTFAARPEPSVNEAPKPNAPKTFKRHNGLVQALSMSPRDHRFLSAGDIGVIEWQIGADGSFVRQGFKNPALGAAYLADGKHILCADEGVVAMVELLSNEVKATFKNPRGNLQCLTLDPDGKHFLTGGSDGSVHWWDVASAEKPAKTMELGENTIAASVAMSPDRRYVAAGASDGSVTVWELENGKRLWRTNHHKGMTTAVAFTPDGGRLISGGIDGVVAMWNVQPEGKPVNLPGRHAEGALCLTFLHKGTGLVSGGGDKTLKFWNYDSGYLLRVLPVPEAVHAVAIPSLDGYVVFSGKAGMVQLTPMPMLDVEVITKEEPPEKKLATPTAAEQTVAQRELRDKYKTQLARAKPEDLEVLADRWLARAGSTAEPSERWALFHASLDTFVKLGKSAHALKAVAELGRWFQIDEIVETSQALTGLVKSADAVGQKEIVDAGLKLLAKIDAESRDDLAGPVVEAVKQASQKAGSGEVVKRVDAAIKERDQAAKAKGRMAELEAKLKSMPDDMAANLEYGLMLCAEDRWADGLPRLVKGSDAALAKLAQRDLAEPKEAKAKAELGYAWADAAEKNREAKAALLARAKLRFEQAQSGLTGEENSKLVLRLGRVIAELNEIRPPKPKDTPTVAGGKPAGSGDKPAVPPKPGETRRKDFNSFSSEAVFKTQYAASGKTRWEAGGLRIQDGGGGFESKFLLVDNWRIELMWDSDSRPGTLEVHGQSIAMPAGTPRPGVLVIERTGKKLSYQRWTAPRRFGAPTVIELSGEYLAPSRLRFQVDGQNNSNAQPDGTLVRAVIIDGKTRPVEEEKKEKEPPK